jgi:hypothetical protein
MMAYYLVANLAAMTAGRLVLNSAAMMAGCLVQNLAVTKADHWAAMRVDYLVLLMATLKASNLVEKMAGFRRRNIMKYK